MSAAQPPARVLRPMPLSEFLAKQYPPRALLLEPWLPEKGLAMIAAPRGVGKTHVALRVAYAVATAGTFLNWKAPAAKRVLYVDGEMPSVVLQARLAEIAAQMKCEDAGANLTILAADDCELGLPDLSTHEGQAELAPHLSPYDLIVFDNLSTLCRSGRENEAESWGVMQAFLLELRRAGKSALLIHHTGKGGGQRGTSKREDVLDSVLLLKRPENYCARDGARFIVTFDKARGFAGLEAQSFEAALCAKGKWSMKASTANRDAEVKALLAMKVSVDDIARDLSISRATVYRTRARMRAENCHAD